MRDQLRVREARLIRSMNLSKFLRFWFPVVAYSAIIFYVSGLPNLQAPSIFPSDKAYHFLEYLFFGALVARALKASWPDLPQITWAAATFMASFLYGLSDETHQIFVEGRVFDLDDLAFDVLGGLTGWILYFIFYRYFVGKFVGKTVKD